MFYYKAETTMTVNGVEVTLTDIKASERNYSHAVITVSTIMTEFYTDGSANPSYGEKVAHLSFHQGFENAVKASQSSAHANYGGKAYIDRKGVYKYQANPTADSKIVETTLVDAKTYREFKKGFITVGHQMRAAINK